MDKNTYEAKIDLQAGREFVDELIYENIRLMDENIRLEFANRRLEQKVEELERLMWEERKNNYLLGLRGLSL